MAKKEDIGVILSRVQVRLESMTTLMEENKGDLAEIEERIACGEVKEPAGVADIILYAHRKILAWVVGMRTGEMES